MLFTDRTGLLSWRRDCPDSPLFGKRGFVVNKDDVFGIRIVANTGVVGFDNQEKTACDDLTWMTNFENKEDQLGVLRPAFLASSDCWEALKKEVRDACDKEKTKNQCEPVNQKRNPHPLGG
ncbi:MAG: hypothetical protein IPJ65_02145 [Archangiaceae bacterium]|nr:hypothetical protein [Archangiaceae bacterium]